MRIRALEIHRDGCPSSVPPDPAAEAMAAANAAPVALVTGKAIEIMKTNRGVAGLPCWLESVHDGKAGAISVDGKDGPIAARAAASRRPVENVSRHKQSRDRNGAIGAARETMQDGEPCPVPLHGEDRAQARTSASRSGPIQCISE